MDHRAGGSGGIAPGTLAYLTRPCEQGKADQSKGAEQAGEAEWVAHWTLSFGGHLPPFDFHSIAMQHFGLQLVPTPSHRKPSPLG